MTDFCYFFLSSAWAGQIPLLWSLNILGWKCKAGKLVLVFYFSFSCFIGHPKGWREHSTQNTRPHTHFPTSQNPCCTNTIKIHHQEMALKPVCCKHAQFQQTVNRFPHLLMFLFVSNRLHRITATSLDLSLWLTKVWRRAVVKWCHM